MNELIEEKELSSGRVARILTDAYLDVELNEDGHPEVDIDGLGITIAVDSDRHFVHYYSVIPTPEQILFGELVEACRLMNDEFIMVRFTPASNDDVESPQHMVVCDYVLSYKGGGVTPKQLIETARLFENITSHALTAHLAALIPDEE